VVYDILFIWRFLGDAAFGAKDVCELEGAVWKERYLGDMESGSFVSNLVSLERK
jgi:hypothetical protein